MTFVDRGFFLALAQVREASIRVPWHGWRSWPIRFW